MHMAPERESALAQLLQSNLDVGVTQVQDEELLEPNHIYVIPPGYNLATIDSHLRLSKIEDERIKRAPIDHFLRALAATHGERAIGVILSGTGSDGAAGMSAIKEQGGLCIVQTPSEADFPGMPQSALATGNVDIVLPVEQMAQFLYDAVRAQPELELPDDGHLPEQVTHVLRRLFMQLRAHNGHDFSHYKPATVIRRLRRRMQLHRISDITRYVRLVRENEEEAQALFEDLLITVSSFFRDRAVFEELEHTVIPALFSDKGPGDTIRVWSVGCSTGEEAYSLAMLLLEQSDRVEQSPVIQVFASDINERALARAREGRYPELIEADVSPERLKRWFSREDPDGYRIKREVRERVLFASHNFLRDPPFSRLDLLACRNVLIYLQRGIQAEVLDIFHYAIRPEGFLVLGTSETVDWRDAFKPFKKDCSIYQRGSIEFASSRKTVFSLSREQDRPPGGAKVADVPSVSFGEMHARAVERYGGPSLFASPDLNILHYSENVGRYVVQPGGEPTSSLLKRVREELRTELRSAVFESNQSGLAVRTKPVRMLVDGLLRAVSMRVQVTSDPATRGHILVSFEDEPLASTDPAAALSTGGGTTDPSLIEMELDQTKQRLRSVVEQYETSQEEMRSAYEELQSSNEELRSTLEELETSKEELQSMNEELSTLNQENKSKVEELSQITSDLQNLMAATDIATLFLDRNLRILRFTPRVSDIFSVRQTDRGRPVTDFVHTLGYMDLPKDAEQVFHDLIPLEKDVQTRSGTWYLLRILPYRSASDRIEGVVVTLVDISKLKQQEKRLLEREIELQELAASLELRVNQRTREVRDLASRLGLAAEKERTRIAHVLHDDLQQMLVSLQMHLQLLVEQGRAEGGDIVEMRNTLDETIELTRNLAIDMDPPVLRNEGLSDCLSWLKEQMRRLHGLEVQLQPESGFPIRTREVRVMLFQTVRELLFNVVKHAKTKKVSITLTSVGGGTCIKVQDSGVGFSKEAPKGGLGLSHMRERVELFGGSMEIDTAEGKGTTTVINMPESAGEGTPV